MLQSEIDENEIGEARPIQNNNSDVNVILSVMYFFIYAINYEILFQADICSLSSIWIFYRYTSSDFSEEVTW